MKNSEHGCIALLASIPLTIIEMLWGGFVVKTLWNWFIPSTFHAVPALTLPQAIGLDIVVSILTYRRVAVSNRDEGVLEGMLFSFFTLLIAGLMFLIIGLVVHGFM